MDDPEVHGRILREVLSEAPSWGWKPLGLTGSPIAGGSGNREYLLHARRCEPAQEGAGRAAELPDIDIDALVRLTLMG